jgi:hypothetical protein
MDDPDFIRELDTINDAKRVAAIGECDLQDTRAETVKGLGNVSFSAFRRDRINTSCCHI